MNIVWFRRDLRTNDHLPLFMAAKVGEVLPIYIIDPSFWQEGTLSARHFSFVLESLEDLSSSLSELGGTLCFAIGEAKPIFQRLQAEYGSIRLYFHKDTWDSNACDQGWLIKSGIPFEEIIPFPFGEESASSKRMWLRAMEEAGKIVPPVIKSPPMRPDWLFTSTSKLAGFPVKGELIPTAQPGGERYAMETLNSFFESRYVNYLKNKESLFKASNYSSRLSPYLTWGNISLKCVVKKALRELNETEQPESKKAVNTFLDSLYKRFLVCETTMMQNSNGNFPVIQGRKWTQEEWERITSGKTGIPIIDAAVLSLKKSGWLPYSLRAVLVFFVCGAFRIDSDLMKRFLGSHLLDYDPCINNAEVDLCLSFAGKGHSRYFHPIKAGEKLDKEGEFIKRHLPQLRELPAEYVHKPWCYPGFYHLGYPVPMVDSEKAYQSIKLLSGQRENPAKKHPKNLPCGTKQLTWDFFN
ncbi:FAD-binding domain-containing protein [Bacillus sp. FJAT-27445]|uniref:FAD-binding domain-containing protein n=1 Tax=Bacillus sp. FJAT-27445 TaxID=1679166 RepID=UPI000A8980D7|nr:FAD-binding domain-containing protein [Bacillus sp. FJAT-27445]